jgi:hypothetical protein
MFLKLDKTERVKMVRFLCFFPGLLLSYAIEFFFFKFKILLFIAQQRLRENKLKKKNKKFRKTPI